MEKDKKITKNTSGSGTAFLTEAVRNSELLLEYATKKGLDVKQDWIATVIKSGRASRADDWTTELEIDFWLVYRNLSAIIQPVTIDSLRATRKRPLKETNFFRRRLNIEQRQASSSRSVRNYLLWALVFIIILLVVQVFSLKGTTLLNNIQANNKRIEEVEQRKKELRLILSADEDNERAKLERYALESERERLNEEINSSISLLEPWVEFLRNISSLRSKNKLEANTQKETVKQPIMGGPGFGPPGESNAEVVMNDKIRIIQESQNFTQIIQLYILPLLYGLIGGFVFVLRGLAYDIRNQVFSSYSNIKYSLRIHLGALAGIIVGLLWGDIESSSITFLESLSTAAIAFISGYGVEYVFNGLDNLAENIIGKPKTES
ncbi:MAG: hypothetical protein U9N85_13100 [Bacteroidota bacterium]|nr:hypothetical protein [Bacteroidota bacterium]